MVEASWLVLLQRVLQASRRLMLVLLAVPPQIFLVLQQVVEAQELVLPAEASPRVVLVLLAAPPQIFLVASHRVVLGLLAAPPQQHEVHSHRHRRCCYHHQRLLLPVFDRQCFFTLKVNIPL